VQLLDALSKECTDTCLLVGTILCLGDLDILMCPLLQQCGQKTACKTDGQAQEPEYIDPDGIHWWREHKWNRQHGRNSGVRSVGIRKELIDILKIECGGVLRVQLEVLN